jgi:hypothetical protein
MGIFIVVRGITVAVIAAIAIVAVLDVLAVVTAIFIVAHHWNTSSEKTFTIHACYGSEKL